MTEKHHRAATHRDPILDYLAEFNVFSNLVEDRIGK